MNILKSEKKFWMFPIISAISLIILIFLPFTSMLLSSISSGDTISNTASNQYSINYGFLFIYYLLVYTSVFYFNAAFIITINDKLENKPTSILSSLNRAAGKFHHLLGWAVISATVSTIIHALEDRKIIGFILALIISVSFSLLCFFVMPILALENIGPIAAMKKSKKLFTNAWGSNLKARFGFGLYAFVYGLAGPTILYLGIKYEISFLIVIGAIITIATSIVFSMLRTIFVTVLYRHASGKPTSQYFSNDDLENHSFKKSKFRSNTITKA